MRLKYDALNRLTNLVDAAGTTVYGYTAGNQLWTEDQPWASDTVTNTYQNRLRVALALAQPAGYWTNGFLYDAARRLTNVSFAGGAFSYEYSGGVGGASGFSSALVRRLLLPNTSAITNDFDNVGRELGTYLRTSAGVLTNKHEYTYNAASQRTAETRMDLSTLSYSYDPIGQLKVADSSVNSEDRGYAYDTAWNLNYRTNNGSVGTFQVDGKNELTNAPSPAGAMAYDGNGNLVSGHAGWVYSYDDENRLVQIEDTSSHPQFMTKFVYDGLSRLRKRQEYGWTCADTNPPPGGASAPRSEAAGSSGGSGGGGSSCWSLLSETRYIYDGLRPIQERDSNNVPVVTYTRGNDLSGSLEGAGGIGGLLARSHGYGGTNGAWSTHSFYHADGNGNVTYMLNSSQSMVASYRYDPFGNLISSSGSLASTNVYRFSSKEFHERSGLYYYLYRFYDPGLQRWINSDPLQEVDSLNLHEFCANAPGNRVDSDGRLVAGRPPARVLVKIAGPILAGPLEGAVLLGGILSEAIDILSTIVYPDPGSGPLPLPPMEIVYPSDGGGNPVPQCLKIPHDMAHHSPGNNPVHQYILDEIYREDSATLKDKDKLCEKLKAKIQEARKNGDSKRANDATATWKKLCRGRRDQN